MATDSTATETSDITPSSTLIVRDLHVEVDGTPRLEVGVGRFDREISAMMFSNVPTAEALAKAVEMVRRYRRPGATTHPLRDLVPERWLRRLVLADPSLVGAAELIAVDTTIEPESLRESQPSAAVGVTAALKASPSPTATTAPFFTAGRVLHSGSACRALRSSSPP